MTTLPYFVFSLSTILSLGGLFRGPDPTRPTPVEDWRQATVDVIIPALNEEHNIALCLVSVLRQTVRPRRIVLIDDGSTDPQMPMRGGRLGSDARTKGPGITVRTALHCAVGWRHG